MATIVDISSSGRIGLLTQLMAEMSGLTRPQDAMDIFSHGMQQAYAPTCAVQLSTLSLPPGEYRISRMLGADGVDHVARRAAWDYHLLPVQSGGVLSQIVKDAAPCIIHDLDLSGDPVLGEAIGCNRSLAAVPVLDRSLPINWLIVLHSDPRHFDVKDLEELILRANLVGAISKGLWVSQQLEEANQRIAREIEQIARIQRTLLPSQLPDIPGLAMAARYETFDRAGGDLYDFARMEGDPTTTRDDRWAILIADASGHGPAAATVCAIVHSILHAYPKEPSGPAELLRHVNQQLCAKQIESSFVTAFLAFYQASTRELVCARAGHNPPLHVSGKVGLSGRIFRELDGAKGLPLGIDADASFTEDRLILKPGEMVVLYTDGITEAKNAAGEFLGIEGIERALATCYAGAEGAVQCIIGTVMEHRGKEHPNDDQTILVLEGRA
jgi:sigma-B regulation protein RsbU (phosphoserine phosphatase)